MFDYKLTVFRRKLFKYVKETLNLRGVKRKDGKAVAKRQQRPLYWKLNRSTYLFRTTEETPAGRVFSAIYRCLNFSVAAIISPYPNVSKLWKTVAPSTLKDESKLRSFCAGAPPLSRAFNGKSPPQGSESSDSPSPQSPPMSKESESVSAGADSEFLDIKADLQKSVSEWKEPSEVELQPSWNRLASPLPPEQAAELPATKPNVKAFFLAMGPARLHKEAAKEDPKGKEQEKYKLDYPLPPLRSRPLKKNYFNFKHFKTNEYTPQVEISPKMNALLFDPVTLSLHYDRVNAPTKIFKDEVLVQVIYSGVSATDVFITEGKIHCGEDPIILGHEISGKVYAVGTDVQHVQKGDDVAVNAFSACCICRYCSRGLFSSCLKEGLHSIGALINGGWAQYVIVKKSQVHKIPEGLGLDQAALIQPLSCILCALPKLNILYGSDIFIQGLGLSGCLWASLLHSRGHKNVIVTDKSEKKKAQFESLDLNYDFVPPEDIVKQSADVIIECAGSPNHIEKSFNIVNSNGRLCFFGKPNPMLQVRCLPYDIIKKEITIVGTSGNAFCFTEALDVAKSLGPRYLDFEKLGVHTFDLRDYKEAFQLKKSGEATKIVFKLDS